MSLDKRGRHKPYQVRVKRGGKQVHLGYFATADEAALCVARSPEGQAIAAKRPAAASLLTSEEARQQAQAEGLTLLVAETKTGYHGVSLDKRGWHKPYQVRVKRGGKHVHLGYFAIADEAALCVARSPEGHEAVAAERAAAAVLLTSEEARRQAQAEGRTLRVAESKTGDFVWRGGKIVSLGCFATAEETALCVARSPEGQAAARRAASAERT